MTDYTQMTDQELADAVAEIEAVQSEQSRRNWVRYAPSGIFSTLQQAPGYGADKVEILLAAINMSPSTFEPGMGGSDVPVIDDAMAQQVIDALEARLAQ